VIDFNDDDTKQKKQCQPAAKNMDARSRLPGAGGEEGNATFS
jgi:hypothetical protein